MLWGAGFKGECALSGSRDHFIECESLVDGLCAVEPVKTGAGEHEGVTLAFFQLAQTGINVAAQCDELEVRPEAEELCATAGAGGANACVFRQCVQGPEWLTDEGVTGVCAGWDGGEGEAGIEHSGQVFEGVDGEIDAAVCQRLFNFLDEDAFAIQTWRDDEAGVLHAVARGADDFNLYGVTTGAQLMRDVISLPESELRTTRADADLSHSVLRIRRCGLSAGRARAATAAAQHS